MIRQGNVIGYAKKAVIVAEKMAWLVLVRPLSSILSIGGHLVINIDASVLSEHKMSQQQHQHQQQQKVINTSLKSGNI